MKKYLLIESRGEASGAAPCFGLAQDLKAQGATVEILLIQNGVLPARAGAKAEALTGAIQNGVPVAADDFSMRERALPESALVKGVQPAPIDLIVQRLAEGWKLIWH